MSETLSPITLLTEPRVTASAAIIVTDAGRFLLQHRDARPGIWYPDHWSLFGGAMEDGERPEQTLARELDEEVGLRPSVIRYFTQVCFDLRPWELGIRVRYVFEVPVTAAELSKATLNEGQAMRLFSAADVLSEPKLTPYDSLALRLYLTAADMERSHGE